MVLGIEVDSYLYLSQEMFREVINFTTNSFFLRWGGTGLTALFESSICWAIIWLTGWCWLVNSYLVGILRGTFIGSVLLLFFGLDAAVLPALATFPWIMSAFGDTPYKILICIASSTINCAFGLGVSLASYLLAVATEIINTKKFSFSSNRRNLYIGLLIHCTTLLALPYPTALQFPNQARVVPDDGIPGMVRPLLGKGSPIPYIDNISIEETFNFWVIVSLIIVLSLTITTLLSTVNYFSNIRSFLPSFTRISFNSLTFTSTLLILIAADLFLPKNLADIAPLATFRRIIPHLFFYSLSPLCFGVAIITFLSPIITLITSTSMIWVNSAIIMLIILVPTPFLHQRGSEEPFKKSGIAYEVVSPGYAVLRRLSNCVNESAVTRSSSLTVIIPPISTITSGGGADKISALQDGDLNSRWTYGGGKQLGTEWVKVTLVEPTIIDGIRLKLGPFYSDFGRAIKITECADKMVALYKSCDWLGPAYLTKKGIPFFGLQSDTTYVFSQPRVVHCLKIEQLGKDSRFDWSIAELQFINKKH